MKTVPGYILRGESVLTGKDRMEKLYAFKNFPVFMGCTSQPSENDIFADMEWGICLDTGCIQLLKLLPLEILYMSQHNEGYGNTWTEHYAQFVDFLKKFDPKNILEVGGSNGCIAQLFTQSSPDACWTVVEPNPTFQGNKNIRVVSKWFDSQFVFDGPVDAIVHSHVFEHTYNPAEYICHIARLLEPGKKHIFSFPNLFHFMKNRYTNCLNFEHTVFLTEHFTDYLLKKSGFRILEKKYFMDHSIFYATEKAGSGGVPEVLPNKYEEYRSMFMDFIHYHLGMVEELNQKINGAKNPVYLFGGHIFSQFLIAFGLNTKNIAGILDNGPQKQGKRLYGTLLMVSSPKILADKKEVNVILKAANYNNEIKKDILENINDQVVFW
ncbi:MAG: class I SAM-dependent methyltransferase [Deltaproteobacteria bacterium]|nr:class I SAM-dependent methyltransferase [Deltaproteobacteria bacterium]